MTVRVEFVSESATTDLSLDEVLAALGQRKDDKRDTEHFLLEEFGMVVDRPPIKDGRLSFEVAEGYFGAEWVRFFETMGDRLTVGSHLCFHADEGIGIVLISRAGMLQGKESVAALMGMAVQRGWK